MSKSKLFLFAGVFCLTVIVGVLSLSFMTARVAHAVTRLSGYSESNNVWTASSSPYILTGTVVVPAGMTLTIGPGVEVTSEPFFSQYQSIITDPGATVNIIGTPTNRVNITDKISTISIKGSTVNVSYADIHANGIGLYLYAARATISSSTFSHTPGIGIYSTNSIVDISHSDVSGNSQGIFVTDDITASSSFSIKDSTIVGNKGPAIQNDGKKSVDARNNWWGSNNAPAQSGENFIMGPVIVDPWIGKDMSSTTDCCSSVLFIPGFEGSRLYNSKSLPLGLGSSTTRLWEPLSSIDVQALYLRNDGSTIDSSIYSNDLLDIALFTKGIYYKLIKYMDSVVKDGTIVEWKPFAYDWRQPIETIVNGQQKRATTTESLLETVKNLATHSKTGKVTIVAHSNGGLIAKYLVKTLSELGKTDLIDKMISVAVPYLGTPQAIAGLLHGSDQSLAFGLILKEYVARGLGVNMASAYSLLPSDGYFNKVSNPVITFGSTTVTGMNDGSYPLRIADFDGQSSFIADTKNGRVVASTTSTAKADTALAIKGNQLLMDAARSLHSILDPFSWPVNIINWAIVGWNKNTTSGVAYSEKKTCLASILGLSCTPKPAHEKILTKLGDGTVVAPSAIYDANVVAAVDLETASAEAKIGISHANILESSTTLALIDAVVRNGVTIATGTDSTALLGSLSMMNGVTIGEPKSLAEPKYLVVSTHSPVELHVYDSLGNHTGTIPSPIANVTGVGASLDLYTSFETNITGSDFSSTDEGDSYVYVPDDGRKYNLEIRGIGVGEFTLDVERKNGADTLQTVEYSAVPTNPLTVASTTVQSGSGNAIVAPLSVDEDGDGKVDMIVQPNTLFDSKSYLEMYKLTIATIAGTTPKGKALIKRIDKLEGLIFAGKLKTAHDLVQRIDSNMNHMKWNKLSASDIEKILDMFDVFIQQFE